MMERVLERLKSLGVQPPEEDMSLLASFLEKARDWVLAETGQTSLPETLGGAVSNMAAGEYMLLLKTTGRLEALGFQEEFAVRQMSQGDTSVTYAVEGDAVSPLEAMIRKLMTPDEALLRKWRRFRW